MGGRPIRRATSVFTWNGTTSGVRVPNADWIAADRTGLTICDATSARFRAAARLAEARCRHFLMAEGAGRRGGARHAHPLTARGGSAGRLHRRHGRCRKFFRLTKGGKLNEGIFEGETINTPSMLCVEDYLDTLEWAKSAGGLKGLQARANANAKVINRLGQHTDWIDFLGPRSGAALEHVGNA